MISTGIAASGSVALESAVQIPGSEKTTKKRWDQAELLRTSSLRSASILLSSLRSGTLAVCVGKSESVRTRYCL